MHEDFKAVDDLIELIYAGKYSLFWYQGSKQMHSRMCQNFLYNPIFEQFRIHQQ